MNLPFQIARLQKPRNGHDVLKVVSIVTVNYNQPVATEALLASVYTKNQYPGLEVIVVDNGSAVNPIPEWKARFPKVIFLRSEENLGFAGGNNLGLGAAKGDYLFLVNNDTELTPMLVTDMVAYMEADPKIGIASPKIRYYDNPELIQYAGYTTLNFYTARNACIGQHELDCGQYDANSGETAYAHGAAMMLRREAIEAAGLMPETYFLYYEEMDWCEAIRRAGYTVHVNTCATIYHKESVSVGKRTVLKEYFMNRNRILFIRRNASRATAAIFYCYFLAVVAPRNLLQYLGRKERGFTAAFFKAMLWHTNHRADSNDLGYAIP